MRLILRAITSASVFLVLMLALGGSRLIKKAAHFPNLSVTGWGSATIDGVMSPGEWTGAGQVTWDARIPVADGGGTTPATLFVMNDSTTLYLAFRIARASLGSNISVVFDFDNDHDGFFPSENGDDLLFLSASNRYQPRFYDGYRYSLSTGSGAVPDTTVPNGIQPPGTIDGAGWATNDGVFTYMELSHPLNSSDDLHDFSLSPGQTVGFSLDLTLWQLELYCAPPLSQADCGATSRLPALPPIFPHDYPTMGDIVLATQYQFAGFFRPADNLPIINTAVAGQTVPIKWSLTDVPNGQPVSDPAVVTSYGFQPSACPSGGSDAIDEYASAASSILLYDAAANQFILNWKTDRTWAGQCGTFTLVLRDGSSHSLQFQFR